MRQAYELFENAINRARDESEEAHAEDQRHRERDIIDALNEAQAKGVSLFALKTLAFETGARGKPLEA